MSFGCPQLYRCTDKSPSSCSHILHPTLGYTCRLRGLSLVVQACAGNHNKIHATDRESLGIPYIVFESPEAALAAADALDMTNVSGLEEEHELRARSEGDEIWCRRRMEVMMDLMHRRPLSLDRQCRHLLREMGKRYNSQIGRSRRPRDQRGSPAGRVPREMLPSALRRRTRWSATPHWRGNSGISPTVHR
jgi:hypothetical protein